MRTRSPIEARSVLLRAFHFSQRPRVLFVAACAFMVLGGRVSGLVSELLDPFGALLGLLLGPLVFLLSVGLLTEPRRALRTWVALLRSTLACRPGSRRVATLVARATYEESFWRGTLQVLLARQLGVLVAVPCIAGLFTARHVYLELVNHRPRGRMRIMELVVFASILGSAYALSQRLTLVILIHASRNVLLDVLARSTRARAGTDEHA